MKTLGGVSWKVGLILIGSALGMAASAHAKCSRRVADPLILGRYEGCNPRALISYLYNDLVTPFSISCAKTLLNTCKQEGCSEPKDEMDEVRCQTHYIAVLSECEDELDGAAKMAKCQDTRAWPRDITYASRGSPKHVFKRKRPTPAPALSR